MPATQEFINATEQAATPHPTSGKAVLPHSVRSTMRVPPNINSPCTLAKRSASGKSNGSHGPSIKVSSHM
eukprot:6294566-Amphidinium_carterae.1